MRFSLQFLFLATAGVAIATRIIQASIEVCWDETLLQYINHIRP